MFRKAIAPLEHRAEQPQPQRGTTCRVGLEIGELGSHFGSLIVRERIEAVGKNGAQLTCRQERPIWINEVQPILNTRGRTRPAKGGACHQNVSPGIKSVTAAGNT
jgi:hypothetical protein